MPRPPLPRLVLASGSPRRRRLLAGLGLDFDVRPPHVDESVEPGESPQDHVRRISVAKARATGEAGELVLAADTVVVLGEELLGKPAHPAQARAMLSRLAGHEHRVLTGVTLRDPASGKVGTDVASSSVRLRALEPGEIEWYVATGEPADKAGAYALQGIGGLFVESICGSSSNVIGLPLPLLYSLFPRLGWDLRDFCGAVGRPRDTDKVPSG